MVAQFVSDEYYIVWCKAEMATVYSYIYVDALAQLNVCTGPSFICVLTADLMYTVHVHVRTHGFYRFK